MGFLHKGERDESGLSWHWTAKSPSDPRFTFSGYATSMWSCEAAITEAIEAKAAELGIEPPTDIEIGGSKA